MVQCKLESTVMSQHSEWKGKLDRGIKNRLKIINSSKKNNVEGTVKITYSIASFIFQSTKGNQQTLFLDQNTNDSLFKLPFDFDRLSHMIN